MKTLSIMGPLVLALAFGVIATFVGGCNESAGGKDAGDFCEDACDVLVVCGAVRCVPTLGIVDNCINYSEYAVLNSSIGNVLGLASFCSGLCNEISGEAGAVSTDCADALSDFWECNANKTTCLDIEPLPVIKFEDDTGGVFLPDIGDCDPETDAALEACKDANFP